MQVTETLSQGLKREYKVVFPAKDLAQRLDGQLAEMKDKVPSMASARAKCRPRT